MELLDRQNIGTCSATRRIGSTMSAPGMRSMRSFAAATSRREPLIAMTPDANSAAQSSADAHCGPPPTRCATMAIEIPMNAAALVMASDR